MSRSISLAVLFLICVAQTAAEEKPLGRITSADFPTVSKRCQFFEDAVNAKDPGIRLRVLVEVGYFQDVPEAEYVRFLRRMLRDEDPAVRGDVLRKLYELWVTVPVNELPPRFVGYHNAQMIDRSDEKLVEKLRQECRSKEVNAGWAAYVLCLLQAKQALPELRSLAEHKNIFVRCTAARALIACDDKKQARAILETIMDAQLEMYRVNAARPARERGEREPYYAVVACRTFMELGADEHKAGLDRLITLFEYMEKSVEVNDEAQLHHLRRTVSGAAGRFLENAAAARIWYAEKYKR
jgi:HEAT repeat protein